MCYGQQIETIFTPLNKKAGNISFLYFYLIRPLNIEPRYDFIMIESKTRYFFLNALWLI